jgi:hypothetical protein
MTDKKPEEQRADKTGKRDQVRDQDELERARGWRHSTAEQRKDLLPGTRAWRTDHTEIMMVETPGSEESEVYLRVTDITTGRYVQAPLTADDLEIVAHILQLHAARLRRLGERR